MVRPPRPDESDALVQLAVTTGLFAPAEADALLRATLDELHRGTLRAPHLVRVLAREPAGPPLAWSYAAESPHAPGVWDLWWIGVAPAAQGRGVGRELLGSVEDAVRAAGARVVVIETSDGPALARARAFYPAAGYVERGRIPDFYAPGEAKVVFSRTL